MAFIQINFNSNCLKRNVPVNAIIPNDLPEFQDQTNPITKKPMKTLYLLPGYNGNHQDWLLNAHLQALSEAYHIAIISPCGENSFYLDHKGTGFQYGTYVGEELVDYTRRLFNLSTRREDTYIGGYSMGGYGALRNGLKYHQTFSKIIALSSALILDEVEQMTPDFKNSIADYDYYHRVFGEVSEVNKGDKNPIVLVDQILKEKEQVPEIYMACGKEDFLIEPNRKLAAAFKEKEITFTYEEGEGVHDWKFWNHYIEKAAEWIMKN